MDGTEASLGYVHAIGDVRHFISIKLSYITQVGEIVDIFNVLALNTHTWSLCLLLYTFCPLNCVIST